MELALIIYLIDFLAIKPFLLLVSPVVFLTWLIARFICITEEYTKERKQEERDRFAASWKVIKVPVIAGMITGLFLPSPSTGYKMLAAYAGMEIAQMEETKQAGSKAYEALNKVLDDYLTEEKTND